MFCEVKWKSLCCVQLFVTPWTMQSMEFSRPKYWSGKPFPSPGDVPNPGIEPRSPTLQVDFFPIEPQGSRWIVIPIEIPVILDEFDRLIWNFIYKSRRPRIAKTFLKEEVREAEKRGEKEEGAASATGEDCHKAIGTETVILMQEQTNGPRDPKRKARNRPTPEQKPDTWHEWPCAPCGKIPTSGAVQDIWWSGVKSKNWIPTSCLP